MTRPRFHAGFEERISILKRRHARIQALRAACPVLVMLGGYGVVISGLGLLGFGGPDSPWAIGGGLLMTGLGLLTALATREAFGRALIRADHRLGLRDRLATAHEVLETRARGPYVRPLLRDAFHRITAVPNNKILPLSLPPWAALAPLLILAGGLIHFHGPVKQVQQPPGHQEKDRRASHSLENQTAQLRQFLADAPSPDKTAFQFRRFKKTAAQALARNEAAQKAALQSFPGLLEAVERRNQQDLETLKEQLNMGAPSPGAPVPAPVPGPEKKAVKYRTALDPDQLEERIKKAFGDEVPDPVADRLKDLAYNREFQEYLENLMKKYGHLPGADETDESGAFGEGGEQTAMDAAPDRDSAGQALTGRPDAGQEGTVPGNQVPETRQAGTAPLKQAGGEITKDRTGRYSKGAFSYSVKALSAIGLSRLPEKEIRIQYIRQNEAVMNREPIPPEYRENVRDYFLSIGLNPSPPGPGTGHLR